MKFSKLTAVPAIALAAGLSLAACGPNSGSASAKHSAAVASASARASAFEHSKQVQAEKAQLENEFINNLKASFSPAHPFKSVQAAVQKTFPKGDTAKIETYAVHNFTPAVLTTSGPGSARDKYATAVTSYAISQGATK